MEDNNDRLRPQFPEQKKVSPKTVGPRGGKPKKKPGQPIQTGTLNSTKSIENEKLRSVSGLFIYEYMKRRAGGKVFQMFRNHRGKSINHAEICYLAGVKGFLQWSGKDLVSIDDLFNHHTGNGKYKSLYRKIINRLIRMGYLGVAEYKLVKGSRSVGLTRLGLSVLRAYEWEMVRLVSRYMPEDREVGPIDQAENLHRYNYVPVLWDWKKE